jgi:hypothetical protein
MFLYLNLILIAVSFLDLFFRGRIYLKVDQISIVIVRSGDFLVADSGDDGLLALLEKDGWLWVRLRGGREFVTRARRRLVLKADVVNCLLHARELIFRFRFKGRYL